MGLNIIATLFKLTVGLLTGALSLTADGIDSVFDSVSNVIGLIGISYAAKPADKEHPYGHRKTETMAALVVAVLLFVTTWELMKTSIERIIDPSLIQAEVNFWTYFALVVSIAIHIGVVIYELGEGKRLNSDFLIADAQHTRADIFISVSVIGGFIFYSFGFKLADPILALIVAIAIANIGIGIIRESFPTLVDTSQIPMDNLERIALSVSGVLSCHNIRTRGHESSIYADLHIRVNAGMSIDQAHAIAHEVQRKIRADYGTIQDVVIHIEPSDDTKELENTDIRLHIRRIADGMGVGGHNLRIFEFKGGKYYMDVHLEFPGKLELSKAHELASKFENQVRAEIPLINGITTHIEPRNVFEKLEQPILEDENVAQRIKQIAETRLGAGTCHNIKVQFFNQSWNIIMHCEFPNSMLLSDAHAQITDLDRLLKKEIPKINSIVIHAEPKDR